MARPMSFSNALAAARVSVTPTETGTGTLNGTRWMACDEWFSDFLRRLRGNHARVRRLRLELREHAWDHKIRAEREYDEETENLRRFLAAQRKNAA